MPAPRRDEREWTFEVVEVEREPGQGREFDLEQWLAEVFWRHYLREQEANSISGEPDETDSKPHAEENE